MPLQPAPAFIHFHYNTEPISINLCDEFCIIIIQDTESTMTNAVSHVSMGASGCCGSVPVPSLVSESGCNTNNYHNTEIHIRKCAVCSTDRPDPPPPHLAVFLKTSLPWLSPLPSTNTHSVKDLNKSHESRRLTMEHYESVLACDSTFFKDTKGSTFSLS